LYFVGQHVDDTTARTVAKQIADIIQSLHCRLGHADRAAVQFTCTLLIIQFNLIVRHT
jgi:hypothetical protein